MNSEGTTQPNQVAQQTKFVREVLAKTLFLFLIVNILFVPLNMIPIFGQISAYNVLFPGRLRLPFGERPDLAYNLSLLQLEAIFASHELAGIPKAENEFRVFLLGDSNTWGFLLRNQETLAARLNELGYSTPDGKELRFYNLGYPTISLMKDLLILDQVQQYQPDMIVWLVTLEAFPHEKQLFTPLVQHNPDPVRRLISGYQLPYDLYDPAFEELNFLDKTIVGQRRTLADLIRYQILGVMWAATGIDQFIPETYTPVQVDLSDEQSYYDLQPPVLQREDLAFEVLQAGREILAETPLLLVNEPVFISDGENSDIRYNFYYPRWVYDAYRELLTAESLQSGWHYLDAWDLVPPDNFTNSAIHLGPEGTTQLAEVVGEKILQVLESENITK